MTAANAILILTGVVAVAIILSKILGSLGDLRALFSWRGLASYALIVAAVFLMVAFYGGTHRGLLGRGGPIFHGPIFPGSPSRYFGWLIALLLLLAAIWIDLPRSTRALLRRNKLRTFKVIRDAHRDHDSNS